MTRLPHNSQAERSVLAAVLLEQATLDDVGDLVTPADFYVPGHRAIYAAMLALAETGQPIDPVMLESRLATSGELGLVGGLEGIGKLADTYASTQHARHHATVVRDLGAMRRMVQTAREIAEAGCQPVDSPQAWIASAEQRLLAAGAVNGSTTYVPIGERVNAVVRGIADEAKAARAAREAGRPIPCTGVRTGYARLDQLTGGLQPGDLVVLAGRPSMGKTALAQNIATNVAKDRTPVLIFSMEMMTDQLVWRQVCTEASIDSMQIREGRLASDDHAELVRVGGLVRQLPIVVDDRAALSITAIRSTARRWRRDPRYFPKPTAGQESPRALGLVVIDYLQLGHGEDGKRTESRNLEVGQISAGCKAMAKELGVPVLGLSQLNRAVDSRDDHRPRLSDLRDSGTIEQDADVIMFLYRRAVYEQGLERETYQRDAELILAKQRNGPTGTLALTWHAQHTRFSESKIGQQQPRSDYYPRNSEVTPRRHDGGARC